ncbi:MAG TPA: TIGR00341 family protein, partial [Candidatus Methanofastidiosa archaeon]|nr:TIGR00341 family protein [Candidatus Methanofastidiosa archaeon]
NGIIKFIIFVPDDKLDKMLDDIVCIVDLRYKDRMIEVYSPDFVISSSLKREEMKKKETKERTPVEIIMDSVKEYSKIDINKVLLIAIAGIIAMIGLFMNNVAIIIGAMLLSPMLGPIYSFSINVTVGRGNDAFRNILQLLMLIFIVIFLSAVSTYVLDRFVTLELTDEIMLRTSVSSIYLPMSVFLGLAAILTLTKKITEGLAGVAIAAALLPPAAVTGILLILAPSKAFEAFTITMENILGLMTGGLFASLLLDIVPRKYYERSSARRMTIRIISALVIMIMIIALSLIY